MTADEAKKYPDYAKHVVAIRLAYLDLYLLKNKWRAAYEKRTRQ